MSNNHDANHALTLVFSSHTSIINFNSLSPETIAIMTINILFSQPLTPFYIPSNRLINHHNPPSPPSDSSERPPSLDFLHHYVFSKDCPHHW